MDWLLDGCGKLQQKATEATERISLLSLLPPVVYCWISHSCSARHYFDTDRHRNFYLVTGRCQLSRLRINAENNDAVTVLIGDQAKIPGRIDSEVARNLDVLRLVPCRGQPSGFFVDGEDRDTVMPSVGAVQKLSGGMHLHFRAGRVAGKTLGKRGDGLHG